MHLSPIQSFSPPSLSRAWSSTVHPTLPLIATASSDKSVRIYSLQTYTLHSTLEGGHKRSVRSAAWKPNCPSGTISLVTGSFDATAGIWRRSNRGGSDPGEERRETEMGAQYNNGNGQDDLDLVGNDGDDEDANPTDWEFSLVLEGHDSEVKSVAFSPSGQYLATCSRDKSVWIWEEIGPEGEDEWETVAVLQEHEGDVKAVAWCRDPSYMGESGGELLASASYDDAVRLWREDGEGEWECTATLSGHAGTVWDVEWEPPRSIDSDSSGASIIIKDTDMEESSSTEAPRLLTCSADNTIRVWHKEVSTTARNLHNDSKGIPSTMRAAPAGEKWLCQATLPKVHDLAIYSVAWSKRSGRVASTGSDSKVVIYEEIRGGEMEKTGDVDMGRLREDRWRVLATHELGHGPYEINHVAWCTRYDTEGKGEGREEMIITTGDDGKVRAWALVE